MWLRVSCNLVFDIEIPTPFILMLRPRSGAQQWIERDEFKITPNTPITEFTDDYGNLCQRILAPAGQLSIYTTADVETSEVLDLDFGAPFVEIQNLPNDLLCYLLPSRYCESDRFNDLATSITANYLPGFNQVAAIEDWLRNTISFIPGSTAYPISATEVYNKKCGVCRDLAHLGIALCRSLSIPARMVVGYLHELKPMDMHAWFEAYVGGRWYTFDATQNGPKGGYVAIGYGLDAADVAVFNQFGPAVYPIHQEFKVERIKC
ncbi:transglutaminase family protein [Algibacter amylolyticus]|uniref:Transglutaminase family protein n=1 Tax=Algibacter amylolyticus TaxID=1608400 RepID=A0A5M7B1P4_9FLAO|nr:transglutaminase family protein [Algibacter amylolyticus]KAA5823536.1 transglutaminase family protein [Algibacter amylolyticus]MBB5267690.1 transglutaminase-like putative cysteine protease [Algibacter amylolyticus]TSJ74024.1 transglutaminase family protein [Algibacter amylolyticus]